jgi:CheY-like chemotaxis protein
LRHSEHRYRTLVEQLPIGIYIDHPDDTCTNVYSNPRVIEMLGHPLSDWIGDPDFFAPTPAEAVLQAEAGDVDLVITDVTMPGMNGHEVAERLETSKPELPILLISGYDAQPQDNHTARAILQKPFPLAELTNAVRDLLDAA